MTRKRTNFKQMDCDTYTSYLDHKPLHYEKFVTTTVLGLSVIKISPKNSRMTPRVFDNETGKQIDPKTELTGIDISSKQLRLQLVKVIDEKIQNMSTKGVYHPRRLLPKWQSLNTVDQKLQLFRKYMKAPTSSIGFIRLIAVNLPNNTNLVIKCRIKSI